jgi:hypothetical protein
MLHRRITHLDESVKIVPIIIVVLTLVATLFNSRTAAESQT